MRRFTLLFSVMALGVFAVPHLSHAEDECVDDTVLKEAKDAAKDALLGEIDSLEVELDSAFVPIVAAEMELASALGMKDLALELEAKKRRIQTGGVTTEERNGYYSDSPAMEKAKELQEKGEVLHDSSKVHLRRSCNPLVVGWVRAARLGVAIVPHVEALRAELKKTEASLKDARERFEAANRIQKARMAREVDGLVDQVAELAEEVEDAVGTAELLLPYLEKFGGNYVMIVQFYRTHGIEMPENPTGV